MWLNANLQVPTRHVLALSPLQHGHVLYIMWRNGGCMLRPAAEKEEGHALLPSLASGI